MKRYILLLAFIVFVWLPHKDTYAMSDVQESSYYYEAVQWGIKEKIISGYPDGTFKPNAAITHQQFIIMYTNAFDFNKGNPKSYDDYYKILEQYNIKFDNNSKHNKPIKRGEVAVLLAYANGQILKPNNVPNYNFSYTSIHAILMEQAAQFMLDSKLSSGQVEGKKTASERYGVGNTLTRGQAITFLYRLWQFNMTTLANDVKVFVETPYFTQQADALRSYNLGNGYVYYVMDEAENYRLIFTKDNIIVGGYETAVGTKLGKYVIGQKAPELDNYFELSPRIYHAFVDKHNSDKIHAILWYYDTPKLATIGWEAQFATHKADTSTVSKLFRDLANEFRVKHGSLPLEEHWVLTTAAKAHSLDMAKRNYLAHNNPEGLSPSDRVRAVANNDTEVQGAGENASGGHYTIFSAHSSWINSLGHRNNLLGSDYKYIGFGYAINYNSNYIYYYTTNFY